MSLAEQTLLIASSIKNCPKYGYIIVYPLEPICKIWKQSQSANNKKSWLKGDLKRVRHI